MKRTELLEYASIGIQDIIKRGYDVDLEALNADLEYTKTEIKLLTDRGVDPLDKSPDL